MLYNFTFNFFFIIFPVLLLIFYPTKIFRSRVSRCLCSRLQIVLNIFVEKIHCCYRDGLDGAKDMRSFSGIYFLLRIIVYSAVMLSHATFDWNHQLIRGFVFSVVALFISLSRPYKETFMNVLDSILLSHIASLCYITATTSTVQTKPRLFFLLMHLMIAFPLQNDLWNF